MDKWLIASAIATILQSVVVTVSLIFIWRQIQLQTKQLNLQTELAKAGNTQALVSLSSPFNIGLIQDPEMAVIYAAWEYDLRRFIKRQNLLSHWDGLKNLFQREFMQHVDQVIREIN